MTSLTDSLTVARTLRRRAVIGAIAAGAAAVTLTSIAITAVSTDAAFTDYANVNVGDQGGAPIGVAQTFDIALIGRDGAARQAPAAAPASMAIDPAVAADLAPGRTIETTVTAFNNTPRWKAGVGVTVTSTSSGGMLGHLRFTAVDATTGAVLFGNAADPTKGATLAQATGPLARTLTGVGGPPLVEGASTAGVPAGAQAKIRVIVAYLDDLSAAEKVSLNGSTVPLRVTFTGEKV